MILAGNCSGFLVYGQAYLLLYPEFTCKGMTIGTDLYDEKCIPEYFCLPENNMKKGIDWTVN